MGSIQLNEGRIDLLEHLISENGNNARKFAFKSEITNPLINDQNPDWKKHYQIYERMFQVRKILNSFSKVSNKIRSALTIFYDTSLQVKEKLQFGIKKTIEILTNYLLKGF